MIHQTNNKKDEAYNVETKINTDKDHIQSLKGLRVTSKIDAKMRFLRNDKFVG